MSKSKLHRSVTPFIDILRNVMRRRSFKTQHRYADALSARTQLQPNLPNGPNSKITNIYYFDRDARQQVQPSFVLINQDSSNKLISGMEIQKLQNVTLGKTYQPDYES